MDLIPWVDDERLLANLIGINAILATILLSAILLRRTCRNLGELLARWTGLHWLDSVSKEAAKGLRAMLFWSTVVLMIVSVLSMGVYHFSGRHAWADFREWTDHLTISDVAAFGIALAKLVGLAIGAALAFRIIRRLRVFFEAWVHDHLPRHVHPEASGNAEGRAHLEETIRRWFTLLERFGLAVTLIAGLWFAARILKLEDADGWGRLVLKVVVYLMVARLLTLSCRTMFHVFTNVGNKHFDHGTFRRYWERIVRLFPFGERCFEAAVWIFAASQCIGALDSIASLGDYGGRVVACIGIFFGTRMAIELLHVFIKEAFGMYEEDRPQDQKGLTLVPLLESVSQYVLYFGCALTMLHTLKFDTTPILAGSAVVGLAVGLGAQNFIADVVAGFFILFENQFLVGDIVQIGDALGKVEAISIRTTQIRDESGKLVIIPNGQIKTVINYSKEYVNAVVDIKTPTSANLEQVMRDMAEAGRRLRERRREVIGETVIKGLVELTPSDMVIRAVTKVQPGMHLAMQQEYRRLLKEVFDENTRASLKAA